MKRGNKVLPTSAHRMPPLSIVSNQYHHMVTCPVTVPSNNGSGFCSRAEPLNGTSLAHPKLHPE